jgi:hypothetical protein
MGKLTPRQRELLTMLKEIPAGLNIYGPREYRTAKSLHAKKLIELDFHDHATITPAGRQAMGGGHD